MKSQAKALAILGITARYMSNRKAPEKTTKAGEKEAAINILNPKNTFNISALFPPSPHFSRASPTKSESCELGLKRKRATTGRGWKRTEMTVPLPPCRLPP